MCKIYCDAAGSLIQLSRIAALSSAHGSGKDKTAVLHIFLKFLPLLLSMQRSRVEQDLSFNSWLIAAPSGSVSGLWLSLMEVRWYREKQQTPSNYDIWVLCSCVGLRGMWPFLFDPLLDLVTWCWSALTVWKEEAGRLPYPSWISDQGAKPGTWSQVARIGGGGRVDLLPGKTRLTAASGWLKSGS